MRPLALIGLAVLAVMLAGCWNFTLDDAWIYQRYAANLAHGEGVCFNAGERSEGVASLLWTATLAPAAGCRYPGAGMRVAKLLGCLAMATGLTVLGFGLGVGPLTLVLLFPWLALHAVSGMETAAAFLASSVAVVAYIYCARVTLPLACLALALLRPEAALLGLGLGAVQSWRQWRRESEPMTSITGIRFDTTTWWWLVAFAVPLLGYWTWRTFYFGELVPLPVYAKMRGATLMNYGYRYVVPYLPWLALLVWRRLQRISEGRLQIGFVLALVLTIIGAFGAADAAQKYMRGTYTHRYLGELLGRTQWASADPLITCADSGAIPFFSHMRAKDHFGLTDTQSEFEFGPIASYMLAKHPTVIVGISSSMTDWLPRLRCERGLWEAANKAGYTARAAFCVLDDYYLWAMFQPTTPDGLAFEQTMLAAIAEQRALGMPTE